MKLTERTVETLNAPEHGSRVHYDADGKASVSGLGLRVTSAGTKSWTLDYSSASGARRRATLGRWPDLNLAQARHLASQTRVQIAEARRLDPDTEAEKIARLDPLAWKQAQRERALAAEEAPTFGSVARLWWARHATLHLRPNSQRCNRISLDRYLLPRFGSKRLADLTRHDVESMMADLKPTPVQANRTLTVLKTVLNFAVENKVLGESPAARVKRYKERSREVHVARADREKLLRLLDSTPARYRASARAIKLLLWTGARHMEVLGCRWSEIDLERAVWNKPAVRSKSGEPSIIPLNREALALLRAMNAERASDEFLFPGLKDGKAQTSLQFFWASIRREAGLPTLRIHDFRHLFATAAIESGVPIDAIAPLLGHRSSAITKVYAHLSTEVLRAASEKAAAALSLSRKPKLRIVKRERVA